jgi:squalene synthase HpnC
MSVQAADLRSGKGHRDENFPVASRLVAARHRAPILAFYDFVRIADDIADSPTLPASEKLRWLDGLEASLVGDSTVEKVGVHLRHVLAERGLSDRHALDLLAAFRIDVEKSTYETWDDLIAYCALSAMPVGRFVLDVHGESRSTWAASDAVCAALQIINHLQDCGKDWRGLRRCYLPKDTLDRFGARMEDLAADRATPPLLAALRSLTADTRQMLDTGHDLGAHVADTRLACEIEVIVAMARRLTDRLMTGDPLAGGVHLSKPQAAYVALTAAASRAARRLVGPSLVARSKAESS